MWSTIVGLLLVLMALSDSLLARLPLSTSMFWLLAGIIASPLALGLAAPTPLSNTEVIEHLAEVVVLLSLFTSGMKMSVGLSDGRWLLPVRLALLSMLVTVVLVAAAGVYLLGLPLGAAVLLGGILAPTDPVLASDVQVADPSDRDSLRFSLTGEAGLNDGTAFPVVMLGLGLLGLHDIGAHGARWFALDVGWFTVGGIGIGALLGSAVGMLVLYLRRTHKEAVGHDSFLAVGLIALTYGAALLVHAGGFLAVFAAGVALRRIERRETSFAAPAPRLPSARGHRRRRAATPAAVAAVAFADPDTSHADQVATDPQHAPAFMAHAMLSFNEQVERVGEVAAVLVVGLLLWSVEWRQLPWWFVPLLLLVIRPVSVAIGLAGSRTSVTQRALIGWFGIRGIGSLYYLMYATSQGLEPELARTFAALVFGVMVVSITAHGISVTPLMALYERAQRRTRR
ncbi:MAG: cation:proton antiporter [Caldimonas sp.]